MLGALCLAGWATYAQDTSSQQTGDPVADAARKAREEKEKRAQNAQKPKKVFTDDDVKPATPDKPAIQNATAANGPASGAEGANASKATTTAGAQKPEGAEAKEDPNSEKAWRKRFSEQHEKIARAEKELEILQRELDKSQVQYYADPSKAMKEQNNRTEINEKTAKIDAKKKELDALRQQLDDMEAELRKAGGDPGWAQ